MIINEDNYDTFDKLTQKGFSINIKWHDSKNILGYITVDDLYSIIQDLSSELDNAEKELNDTIKELRIIENQMPNEPDPYDIWRDKWI